LDKTLFMKKYLFFGILLIFFSQTPAQVEVSHLSTRGYSSFGGGTMYCFGTAVNRGDAITFETGFFFFDNAILTTSIPIGYRYTLNRKGYGFYLEPQITYAFGAATIPRRDTTRYPRLNNGHGDINQPVLSGLGTFLSVGYILRGKLPLNFGVRYQHIFAFGDPGVNVFCLRLSYMILFGRENYR
jgi:hypothetical protein